jgi:hypothetical protein
LLFDVVMAAPRSHAEIEGRFSLAPENSGDKECLIYQKKPR